MNRFAVAALVLPALAAAVTDAAAQPRAAETVVYTDAVVWRGPGLVPADAFAVRDGRIVAVGRRASAEAAGADARVESLGGAFVSPGFVDAHVHLLSGGFQLASVDLRSARTPDDFRDRLAAFAATQPAGTWIVGGDWDHEAWGGELPTRDWIDAVTPDHPVWVNRLDGHMALANSRALSLARVTEATPVPPGGEIVRGADGRLTGVFKDEAMPLVARAIPTPTDAQFDAALDRAQAHAFSRGVTQVHDMGSFGGWDDLATYRRAHAAGRLTLRVRSMVALATWPRLATYVRRNGRGDDRLKWGGLKGFVDGSLGSTTAWFHAPYDDAPETTGLAVVDTVALARAIDGADRAGLQVAVHAIGDRANDVLLRAFSRAARANGPRDRRFRVEHAQHLSPWAIGTFGRDGVIASMQPYHVIDDGRWAAKRIGDRVAGTYAFRSLLDGGAALAFGSDWTVAPMSVAEGLYAAVTRATLDGQHPAGWVPAQKITVEEALDTYTRGGATAGFWERTTGSITVGKNADFVVLSADPRLVAPEALREIRVLRTVVGGETVYRAN